MPSSGNFRRRCRPVDKIRIFDNKNVVVDYYGSQGRTLASRSLRIFFGYISPHFPCAKEGKETGSTTKNLCLIIGIPHICLHFGHLGSIRNLKSYSGLMMNSTVLEWSGSLIPLKFVDKHHNRPLCCAP